MKKFFAFLLGVFMLANTTSVFAAGIDDTASDVEKLNVQFRHTLAISADTTSSELEELIEIANLTGWEYNAIENVFEKYVSYEGLTIAARGEKSSAKLGLTDEQGDVYLSTKENTGALEYVISDPVSELEFTGQVDKNNKNLITIDSDLTSKLASDQYSDMVTAASGASYTNPYWNDKQAGVVGYRLHCNRFNGPYGNNTYYSNHLAAQTISNFFYSDCDVSINYTLACIRDDLPLMSNYCEAGTSGSYSHGPKEATCSGVEGRSRYFHYN